MTRSNDGIRQTGDFLWCRWRRQTGLALHASRNVRDDIHLLSFSQRVLINGKRSALLPAITGMMTSGSGGGGDFFAAAAIVPSPVRQTTPSATVLITW